MFSYKESLRRKLKKIKLSNKITDYFDEEYFSGSDELIKELTIENLLEDVNDLVHILYGLELIVVHNLSVLNVVK